jgi:DNA gyrase/topoisomerase IV subunit B
MTPEDLFATVSSIVSVNVDNPEFEAQTKNRLGNAKLFRNWQMQVRDEILNYWYTDSSDECELFFQQIYRNIEKREKSKEESHAARINNNL